MLLGVVVDVRGLKGHTLLTLGSLGALLVARAAAVKGSRWSWGAVGEREQEIALWVFPRGLITAVLAIRVLNAQGKQFDFLPALAFATIVVTNVLVILGHLDGTWRTPAREPGATSAVSESFALNQRPTAPDLHASRGSRGGL